MFENEHTFCSWIHHVRTCTAFAQREQRPSNRDDLGLSVKGEVRKVSYTGMDLLLNSFLYRNAWLFLGCVLNDTPCITIRGLRNYICDKWSTYNAPYMDYGTWSYFLIPQFCFIHVWLRFTSGLDIQKITSEKSYFMQLMKPPFNTKIYWGPIFKKCLAVIVRPVSIEIFDQMAHLWKGLGTSALQYIPLTNLSAVGRSVQLPFRYPVSMEDSEERRLQNICFILNLLLCLGIINGKVLYIFYVDFQTHSMSTWCAPAYCSVSFNRFCGRNR
jgi:hypothetical protein